ncbi:MAG TPA: cytochrome c [Polyangiaceae bacterium]|jgi:mono/diheme cytochrome c family protein|nr:cytochrome c [Polyangiaceae bacterium]
MTVAGIRQVVVRAVFSGLWFSACASHDPERDPDGPAGEPDAATPTEPGETDQPAMQVSFADVYAIFSAKCRECHVAGTGHTFIVGSSADATRSSAVQSKASISMRIRAMDLESGRMPPTGPGLSAEEITTIEEWIDSL